MKKKIISLGLVIEIVSFSIIVCFMSPVAVFALSAGGLQSTIASIIISLMLECGVAPVNNAWIQTLNTSYGVESTIGTIQDCIDAGLLTQSGSTLIDTGLSTAIESQSAYSDLKLGELFSTTADDAVNGVIAASGGTNLANVAINCGTVGTIGAFAGAATIGVGLGVLINKATNYIKDFVKYGLPMNPDTIVEIAGNIPDGYDNCFFVVEKDNERNLQHSNYYFGQGRLLYGIVKRSGNNVSCFLRNLDNYAKNFYRKQFINKSIVWEGQENSIGANAETNFWSNNNSRELLFVSAPEYASEQDFKDYVNSVVANPDLYPETKAPDIIGTNGNQKQGDLTTTVPDGYDMNPVNFDDYNNYAQNANNNTNDGNTGEAIQGEQFDNLIDSLLVEPSMIPDQGVETPEVPDRPIIPDQPDTPGKDPITPEQQADVLEGITTPDLRSVFPFCIPFDLFSLLGELKDVNREAPVLVWEMPEELGGYSIILDFSMFDDAAALLRLLELAVFIVGLAIETRNLIGAKG